MVTLFAENVVCTLTLCIMSLFVPIGNVNIEPTGIYLEAEVNWGVCLGTLGFGHVLAENHERGHMIQRQEMDVLYWLFVGVPSAISMHTSTTYEHSLRWYEIQATEYGNELCN